ncbi:DEAD/DEAH box helicase [Mobilitalea sibirica]|uniref:DEAD/DEAH box helicase n=1 Tax=Mobilitalea sibirica TaxID=1462919 RepID=A0A8J7H3N6_9FIRM|nr:DEAD/DEAH box helicase [Mobilitalea sibirica]MBH1941777.1 DEAD/DEAH box helicase [Mobilitalea sibirica]
MKKNGFEDYKLSVEIIRAINDLDITMPTKVQEQIIPMVLDNQDFLVQSQTGTGKTAAFGIPVCELLDWLKNKPQALILTPTRELALQVKDDIMNYGRYKRIHVVALYGKQPISNQIAQLKQKTHVIVGTPGRVMDHLERGTLNITQIRFLVLDEADEMLRMGFAEQIETIIQSLPKERTTMLFSATLPERVKELSYKYMKEPVAINIQPDTIMADKIEHSIYPIEEDQKLALLKDVTIVNNPDSCIIFCSTKDKVEEVYDHLQKLGYPCNKIHGGMEQKERMKSMEEFKAGIIRYLIATDVAARGIDVDNVTLVINYDIPIQKENYVHRVGRTGRAGLAGKAVTFVTPEEENQAKDIEAYIGFSIPVMSVPDTQELSEKKIAFDMKLKEAPSYKKLKSEKLDQRIMKLRFNGGKNKKLRATNFVGVISNIKGVSAEDIGIITVLDSLTFVEILNGKGPLVLRAMEETPIGNRNLKVIDATKRR